MLFRDVTIGLRALAVSTATAGFFLVVGALTGVFIGEGALLVGAGLELFNSRKHSDIKLEDRLAELKVVSPPRAEQLNFTFHE